VILIGATLLRRTFAALSLRSSPGKVEMQIWLAISESIDHRKWCRSCASPTARHHGETAGSLLGERGPVWSRSGPGGRGAGRASAARQIFGGIMLTEGPRSWRFAEKTAIISASTRILVFPMDFGLQGYYHQSNVRHGSRTASL
jgi:hypothetical protein